MEMVLCKSYALNKVKPVLLHFLFLVGSGAKYRQVSWLMVVT